MCNVDSSVDYWFTYVEGVVTLTEKRFENRLDKSNVKFNTLNPVWDNEKEDALNVFEMVDLLNELATKCSKLEKENEQLKSREEYLERKIDRERTSYQKQHEKWEEEIQKENEQLKQRISELELLNDGLNYALKYIKKIAVEIDVGDTE